MYFRSLAVWIVGVVGFIIGAGLSAIPLVATSADVASEVDATPGDLKLAMVLVALLVGAVVGLVALLGAAIVTKYVRGRKRELNV